MQATKTAAELSTCFELSDTTNANGLRLLAAMVIVSPAHSAQLVANQTVANKIHKCMHDQQIFQCFYFQADHSLVFIVILCQY